MHRRKFLASAFAATLAIPAARAFVPLNAGEVRTLRDHQFGNWEMNWIGYNSAEEIELPGRDGLHRPDFAFLIYPCALTSEKNGPCTNPGSFRYEITSTELIV